MLFKRVLFLSVFFRGCRGHNIHHDQIETVSSRIANEDANDNFIFSFLDIENLMSVYAAPCRDIVYHTGITA